MARIAKTRWRKLVRPLVRLRGGPWDGLSLRLDYDKSTIPFSLKGFNGRYVAGEWKEAHVKKNKAAIAA